MQIDWEQHKNDFMLYVWNNLDALNYAIRKNITYDPEIYDDVTADTLVRIAEYILRKHVYIKDFKGMFFLSAKRQYIAEQNRKRQMESIDKFIKEKQKVTYIKIDDLFKQCNFEREGWVK